MAHKNPISLSFEAERRGKVAFWVWRKAKQTGKDMQEVMAEDQEFERERQRDLADYEQYVYGKEDLGVGSVTASVKRSDVRTEMSEILRAFVRKNRHLGLEMPDEV